MWESDGSIPAVLAAEGPERTNLISLTRQLRTRNRGPDGWTWGKESVKKRNKAERVEYDKRNVAVMDSNDKC